MKQLIGLLILVIVLVVFSGCTQPAAPPAPETTPETPVPTTEVTAVVTTPVPATVPVTAATTAAATNLTPGVTATTKSAMTPSTKVTTIHIRNNTFVPNQLTVLPGTGITWINDDAVTHIVKATGDSAGKFTSAEMITGANFHYTFGEATGTFEFGDPKYPDMKGMIIVMKGDRVVGT